MAKKNVLANPARVMKRAVKFASRDFSSEILTHVHLDKNGDVVATDAYILYTEHGVYNGESLDIPLDMAKKLAKCKVANKEAVFTVSDGKIVAELDDGTKFVSEQSQLVQNYPSYGNLYKGLKYYTVAYITLKQVKAILDAHAREKRGSIVSIHNRDFELVGEGDPNPRVKIAKACDGDDIDIAFNPKFLKTALSVVEQAELRISEPTKPIIIVEGNIEVLVMPIRLSEKVPEPPKNTATPKPEPIVLKGAHVTFTGALPTMTRRKAFDLLKKAGGIPCERFTKSTTILVAATNAKSAKRRAAEKAIADGQNVRIVNGDEFMKALVAAEREETEVTEVKVTKARIDITPEGVKATPIESHVEKVETPKPKAKKPKTAPKKPKATKPKTEKPALTAATVSLETMSEWCEKFGRGYEAKRYGKDGAQGPVWVYGVKREDMDARKELTDLGFRFKKNAKHGSGWWKQPAA